MRKYTLLLILLVSMRVTAADYALETIADDLLYLLTDEGSFIRIAPLH